MSFSVTKGKLTPLAQPIKTDSKTRSELDRANYYRDPATREIRQHVNRRIQEIDMQTQVAQMARLAVSAITGAATPASGLR